MNMISTQETSSIHPECQHATVNMIFPVPFFTLQWNGIDNFNTSLKKLILYKRTVEKGIKISNQGGWHSKQDLLDWDDASVVILKHMIQEAIRKMLEATTPSLIPTHLEGWEMEVWANVNPKGSSNISHDHTRDGNQWSGVYYVETGNDGSEEVNGNTIFEDKYYTNNEFYNRVPVELKSHVPAERNFIVKPKEGIMVLFPGTLPHRVETYTGQKERITIAFNLKHKDFGIYKFEDNKKRPSTLREKTSAWMWYNFRGVMAVIKILKGIFS